jgi:hypothetical protein
VPAAAPVAAPVDTVGMAAIPPPSADAKVVAPENASVLNAQAAENAVALEQKADQSAEEQMIAEAAAVKASRPDAPRGKLHLGLRLLGGYSLGLGSFSHGEDVNDAMTPSGNRYAGHPAEGAAGAAELLLAWAKAHPGRTPLWLHVPGGRDEVLQKAAMGVVLTNAGLEELAELGEDAWVD